ncbi:MAG: hypothetical protein ACPL4E_01450 [Thermoproteota archaeon]
MSKLLRKGCWEAKYLPLSSIVNWLGKQVRNNGRRVRVCIELAKSAIPYAALLSPQDTVR